MEGGATYFGEGMVVSWLSSGGGWVGVSCVATLGNSEVAWKAGFAFYL